MACHTSAGMQAINGWKTTLISCVCVTRAIQGSSSSFGGSASVLWWWACFMALMSIQLQCPIPRLSNSGLDPESGNSFSSCATSLNASSHFKGCTDYDRTHMGRSRTVWRFHQTHTHAASRSSCQDPVHFRKKLFCPHQTSQSDFLV